MEKLSEYVEAVEQHLRQLSWSDRPEELYEPIRYLLALGGKRLRPALTLMAADLYGDWKRALSQACAVEMFHNFTLAHDDIMDDAPLRRGQATIHEKWDENRAILSGDALLIAAYQELIRTESDRVPELVTLFNRTALEVCEGQQYDMLFEQQEQVITEAYIEMIRLKTSVLLGCALQFGALVNGATKSDQEKLYEIGVSWGIAFQIQDDYLDVFGDPARFGKQVGGDILSNKKTLLMLEALQRAEGKQREKLDQWLQATSFDPEQKVREVTDLYRELGIPEVARQHMDRYSNMASAAIDALDISEGYKQSLKDFGAFLVQRDH